MAIKAKSTKEAHRYLNEANKIKSKIKITKTQTNKEFKKGDVVKYLTSIGEIVEIKGKNALVEIDGKKLLINVSVDIKNEKTKQREFKALLEAMEYFNTTQAYLITKDEDKIEKINNKNIVIMPLYKWLLNTKG